MIARCLGPALSLLVAMPLPLAPAAAQSFPNRPLRIVTPSAAGTDLIARITAEELGKILGQSVIVDNRPGGSGMVGTDAGARAAPDGYTITITSSGSMILNRHVIAGVPYQVEDFAPIALVAFNTFAAVVNPRVTAASSLPALIADARARPGQVSYGSLGAGSMANVLWAMIGSNEGLQLTHVPYKSANDAYGDIESGLLTTIFDQATRLQAHIRAGTFKALAVNSPQRYAGLAEVPTLQELGLVDFDSRTWWAAYVPAKTPPDVVATLTAAFDRLLVSPVYRQRMQPVADEIPDLTGARFASFQAGQVKAQAALAARLGLTPQ